MMRWALAGVMFAGLLGVAFHLSGQPGVQKASVLAPPAVRSHENAQKTSALETASTAAETPGQTLAAVPPLVDAGWLAANLDKPDLRILDLRGKRRVYHAGHVPGAILSGYAKAGWVVEHDGVPHELPSLEHLANLIGGYGIANHHHVILVAAGTDATNIGVATRVYWTLKVAGHDRVSILDGGHQAYAAAGHRLAKGKGQPFPRETFQPRFRGELLATEEDVRRAHSIGGAQLLDNRPQSQFSGASKVFSVPKKGTIPGSFNVATLDLTLEDSGVFKSKEMLKALHMAGGVDNMTTVIAFCNVGHWASTGWFVLYEILGNKKAKLYDGSMAEWTATDANPVQVTAQ